jgi:hypothetical protein
MHGISPVAMTMPHFRACLGVTSVTQALAAVYNELVIWVDSN